MNKINENRIVRIAVEKLAAHPDNPNRMSKGHFAKLIRNIERTGRYEPLIVRPKDDGFQIINGHNRLRALQELGYRTVDAIVWDIDDEDTDILLATLNRLGGSNVLAKKLTLLKRLNDGASARDLAKLLPHTAGQIERFAQMTAGKLTPAPSAKPVLANPKVFFLDDGQQAIVEQAVSLAGEGRSERTKAAGNAAALTRIARAFTERHEHHAECVACSQGVLALQAEAITEAPASAEKPDIFLIV
jgi:ParB-like chromosome segregation protein Spo0J